MRVMECNKEEAVKTMQIAEKKLENSDFIGARKMAQTAHRLFPTLKNIAQLLTVCEIHCSAQTKIYGHKNDWYGILQIEQSADETTIKKQYRKLALLLHPDKNKFAGAEAAFKLVGEANSLLSDRLKRRLYDMNYGVSHQKKAAGEAEKTRKENFRSDAAESMGKGAPNNANRKRQRTEKGANRSHQNRKRQRKSCSSSSTSASLSRSASSSTSAFSSTSASSSMSASFKYSPSGSASSESDSLKCYSSSSKSAFSSSKSGSSFSFSSSESSY